MESLYSFYKIHSFNVTKVENSLVYPNVTVDCLNLRVVIEDSKENYFYLRITEFNKFLERFTDRQLKESRKLNNFIRISKNTFSYHINIPFYPELSATISKIGEIIEEFIEEAQQLLKSQGKITLGDAFNHFPSENKVVLIDKDAYTKIYGMNELMNYSNFEEYIIAMNSDSESYNLCAIYTGDLLKNSSETSNAYWVLEEKPNNTVFKNELKNIINRIFLTNPNSLSSRSVDSLHKCYSASSDSLR